MSDELIKSLSARIAELEQRKAQLEVGIRNAEVAEKKAKRAYKELAEKAQADDSAVADEVAALQAERDEWHTRATAAPTEQAARIAELEGALRTRDHRDAWQKAVGAELHEKADVAKLWREIDYAPDGDAPDAQRITELVGRAKDAAPYLFRTPEAPGNGATSQGGTKAPLKVADAPGRGARDTASGTVRISRSEMATPGWMTKNKAGAEAFRRGDYTLTDD